ncbi:MAG: hypothetical protein R3F29_10395 [Planctomycetota bacterium]
MNRHTILSLSAAAALTAGLSAQASNYFVSFSQVERTLSGSGGTVLGKLFPNEISYVDFLSVPCTTASAEKWLPRTAALTMAGDENGDGAIWNPGVFGDIDALLANPLSPTAAGPDNQRTIYWSVRAPMGNNVSANPFRPGDVAHIVRNGAGDGQVRHFMRQEHFNMALGLPPANPIDIDAIAFGPNYGVFFSIDMDTPALTMCGPLLVRDGDVLCIPPWDLTMTADGRIAAVNPGSAVVVHTEAQMDFFTQNAMVTDRFGACISMAIDVEALEIDWAGPTTTVATCTGVALPVPALLFTTETGTGGSVLTTAGIGAIHNTPCTPAGTACGSGPTWGPQMGVQPFNTVSGAQSYITGLSYGRAAHHVLEPQQHVLNTFGLGAPAGSIGIDYGSQFTWNLALIEIVPPVVAPSLPAFPFSQFAFPDLYAPSISVHAWPLVGPFGSFPMVAIPAGWSGKVLYQNIGFSPWGTLELSTPATVDVF